MSFYVKANAYKDVPNYKQVVPNPVRDVIKKEDFRAVLVAGISINQFKHHAYGEELNPYI